MAETQTAYLNGIELEMQTLEDHFEKAIVRYEYPYVDGADLEDLGQRAHVVRLRCYFLDNVAQTTYDDHIRLLNLLKVTDDLELVHPEYGTMAGKVEGIEVRHDDRLRTAEIDITFVEQLRDTLAPQPAKDVQSRAESLYATSVDQQLVEITYDIADAGLDPAFLLADSTSILGQLKGVAAGARETAREIDAYLRVLDSTANAVTQPVNSLTATINFDATIPGRLLGSATRCVERVARLYDATSGFPSRFIANLDFAYAKLVAAIESMTSTKSTTSTKSAAALRAKALVVKAITMAAASRLALEAAYTYAADEDNRQLVRQAESTPAFDSLGRRLGADPLPLLMNARELEDSLATVRITLQNAIDLARGVQSLKDLALELLTHVSKVKLESDRIISVEIDGPLPLHLVCLRYGLPYNYAERIRSINPTLVNPNFVTGTLQIYTLPGGGA